MALLFGTHIHQVATSCILIVAAATEHAVQLEIIDVSSRFRFEFPVCSPQLSFLLRVLIKVVTLLHLLVDTSQATLQSLSDWLRDSRFGVLSSCKECLNVEYRARLCILLVHNHLGLENRFIDFLDEPLREVVNLTEDHQLLLSKTIDFCSCLL